MTFPVHRLRRLRNNARLRDMVRESSLDASDLIDAGFVMTGRKRREDIASMPGQCRLSTDLLIESCEESLELGVGAVMLFGIPKKKDARGSEGWAKDGIVPRAIRALKRALPELYVIADVCLCEYTDHGHCGVLDGEELENDPTLELLGREAVAYAEAGADMVAPSAMADGQVGAIRQALDGAGFSNTPIMSYAAKYASGFYGPFRDAADSAPSFGDRNSYQMDPASRRQALREVELDVAEGADIVMVKPALAYLDIVSAVRRTWNLPVAAYNVSGEYAMVKAAAERGWIDGERVAMEILLSIKRAGADLIITYHAKEAARVLAGASAPRRLE